jgi:hypothetical protein
MAKMLVQIQAENPSDVLDTPGVRTVVPEGEQS